MTHKEFVKQTGQSPVKVIFLGTSCISKDLFEDWIEAVKDQYNEQTYHILRHNCNHFSQECSQFLVGSDIPEPIRSAPQKVNSSCLGKCLLAWFALSPLAKRSCALGARWIWSLLGLVTLLMMSRHDRCPAAPGDDAAVNFALVIFAFDILWTSFLCFGLVWASCKRRLLCPLRLEFIVTILLIVLSFSSAVSLSTFHVASHRFFPNDCTATDGNYTKLSVGLAFSWIHCLCLPVVLFLQVYPLARQLATDGGKDSGFVKVADEA